LARVIENDFQEIALNKEEVKAGREISIPAVQLCRIYDTMRCYETVMASVSHLIDTKQENHNNLRDRLGINDNTAHQAIMEHFVEVTIARTTYAREFLMEYEESFEEHDKVVILKNAAKQFGVKI